MTKKLKFKNMVNKTLCKMLAMNIALMIFISGCKKDEPSIENEGDINAPVTIEIGKEYQGMVKARGTSYYKIKPTEKTGNYKIFLYESTNDENLKVELFYLNQDVSSKCVGYMYSYLCAIAKDSFLTSNLSINVEYLLTVNDYTSEGSATPTQIENEDTKFKLLVNYEGSSEGAPYSPINLNIDTERQGSVRKYGPLFRGSSYYQFTATGESCNVKIKILEKPDTYSTAGNFLYIYDTKESLIADYDEYDFFMPVRAYLSKENALSIEDISLQLDNTENGKIYYIVVCNDYEVMKYSILIE